MASSKKASKAKSSTPKTSTPTNVAVLTPSTGIKVVKTNKPKSDLKTAVQARAYELYLKRGCQHGHDVEDWLRAESELVGNYQGRTA